jgi:bifunctional ADP-heptose synthase (sugar kinase/adenylyltransferase)
VVESHVLVIGDVILDRYTYGKALGVSAETPTIVASQDRSEYFLGGAALVMRNLLRLGCVTYLISGIGPEQTISGLLSSSTDGPVEEELGRFRDISLRMEGWSVTQKHRMYVDGYKLLQYDILNRGIWVPPGIELLKGRLLSAPYDSVVICDNRHGFMTNPVICAVMGTFRKLGIPVSVDSQVSQSGGNHRMYMGCHTLFLNEREIGDLLGSEKTGNWKEDLKKVNDVMGGCDVVLKMGSEGSAAIVGGKFFFFEHPSLTPDVRSSTRAARGTPSSRRTCSRREIWNSRITGPACPPPTGGPSFLVTDVRRDT